jgi:Cu(I)/Ag(I) efflux system membrane fusion protein
MNSGAEINTKTNGMNMQQNSPGNTSIQVSSASQLREGVYVIKGQTLFNVNDLQEVWAVVSVPYENSNQVLQNQSVELYVEGKVSDAFQGKVDLIERTFEENNQRFVRIRIVVPNTDNSIKLNSLVTARIALSESRDLQVPSSAVYKTGLNAYVWIKADSTKQGAGIFRAKRVITGSSADGFTMIKSGISAGDEIALQAGLMVDSETFVNAY